MKCRWIPGIPRHHEGMVNNSMHSNHYFGDESTIIESDGATRLPNVVKFEVQCLSPPPPFLVPCCVGGWAAVCCVLLGFLGSLATVVTSLCIYSLLVYFQDKAAAHLKYGGSFWFWSHVFIGEWIWWS